MTDSISCNSLPAYDQTRVIRTWVTQSIKWWQMMDYRGAQWCPGPSVSALLAFHLNDEHTIQAWQHLEYTLIFGDFCLNCYIFEFLYLFILLFFQQIFIKWLFCTRNCRDHAGTRSLYSSLSLPSDHPLTQKDWIMNKSLGILSTCNFILKYFTYVTLK